MIDQPIRQTVLQIPLLLLLTASGCSSPTYTEIAKADRGENPVAISPAATSSQASETPSAAFSARLREIAASARLAGMERGNFSDYKKHFTAIYESSNFAPLWLRNGQPTPQAQGVIATLEECEQKGLFPADYDTSKWPQRLEALKTATDVQRAEFDATLSVAVMRYISDLHIGRINPKHFKFGIDVETKKYDLPQFVTQKVVSASDVKAVLAAVEPPYNGYRRTEEALDHYLALEAKGDGAKIPEVTKSVGVGDTYPGLGALVARLRLLGDMPEGGGVTAYDSSVAECVKHFQQRHGLTDDGKLGAATVRALNVPVASRVKQLSYALERWRWMPPEYPQPPVVVNIPEFRLRAFEGGEKVALAMNVVVGKAAPTQTPVFTDAIQYIVFRPYWNVPPSIVRSSVIPGFNRSGNAYLEREQFEVTGAGGGVPADLVAGLRSGKYSVRQKPGPKNSLGLIKFIFPNSNNVYLHSTPATQLFAQSRRDFSHGCIRLEKPADLAVFLLRNQDDGKWTLDKVQQAMSSGKDNQQVNLATKVPVLILYVTAVVEEDGTVHFFDDIYGHDRKLDAVLVKGPPYP
jgi:murein L,D-transpeptidase YcbB/YkuD